ncbi:MAG: hypothetical protein KBS82_05135 [Oscillospiraceae bacterium]|nr:hypothetical protein [Candidatus Limimonas egerieequi]
MNKPKYELYDEVRFVSGGEQHIGTIEIVDRFGTFEQNVEPSYDIMVHNWRGSGQDMFYKHVVESLVLNKISY